jgi:transposase
MTSMTITRRNVTVGVDTHSDVHHAAVVDELGRSLADAGFPTTVEGYRKLLDWAGEYGNTTAATPQPSG